MIAAAADRLRARSERLRARSDDAKPLLVGPAR